MMLLNLKQEEIKKQLENMDEYCNAVKKNCLQLSWYMRGSVSYEDVLNMSDTERKQLNEIIEANMEVTKKSGLPFF
jgi:hypothetical protein